MVAPVDSKLLLLTKVGDHRVRRQVISTVNFSELEVSGLL